MRTLYLSQIINHLNIGMNQEDVPIHIVENDIRKIQNDCVIFHLNKDVEMDVELFKTVRNCYIISDQPLLKEWSIPAKYFFHVLNVKKAYMNFIHFYREQFNIPVIAVTGTCGKTTTKEMISQVLRNRYNVVSTYLSHNGLRYCHNYLLQIDESTNYAVYETGLTNPGHIIASCEFYQPTIGVITTIGIDHLNGCKTMDNYIRAKGEMISALHERGTLIINQDDPNIQKIDFSSFNGKIITFGLSSNSDFMASHIHYFENGMRFTLTYQQKTYDVFAPGFGEHNVMNCLAALAVLTTLNIDLNESIHYMASFEHIRSHLAFHKGRNKSTIIDDTWSSNPTSMKAALQVLHDQGKAKTKITVLGKINYLGRFAEKSYKEIAKMLIKYKIDYLITQDEDAKIIAEKAIQLGMNPKHVLICKSKEDVQTRLDTLLDEDAIVLFKISMLDQSLSSVMKENIID